jgi:type I restriction enzyme S subunit
MLTIASTEFVGLIPKKVNQQFLFFLATSEQFRQRLDSIVQSVTRSHQRADPAQIYKFWSALPPLSEQQAIAAFLDRETGRIDALIARKERLLELLAEQRTALISRAVTKGLDASVKLKPSGVEWLGDVPEHWEVKRAGLAYKIQLGKMLQPDTSTSDDEQFAYLKALHVQWEKIQTDDLPVMWASKYELSKYSVKRGDLLVCEGGEVGRAVILQDDLENVIIQNSLHRVRSNNNLNTFLMYVLENAASKHWFEILCNKATIAHFTGDKFSALRIPLPPLPEQQAIAAFLDRETAKIDELSAKVTTVIERLKEYRTALISSAVTGKIDVREAV